MTHVIIPDTQVGPDTPTDHLRWIGQYIVDKWWGDPDLKVIHLGDHWDMPSLSSYDKGKRQMEGRRYVADVKAGNDAFTVLNGPLDARNEHKRQLKEKQWNPIRYLLRGNHEDRIQRAIDLSPQELDGLIGMHDLKSPGWDVVPFKTVLWLDGIAYSHFFEQKGRPMSGMIESRLKALGHSFVQGHIPGRMLGDRPVLAPGGWRLQVGVVAGSCYLHEESYQGPQGNAYWRGIIVLHQVEDGQADIMTVSLDYLCRKYAGVTLKHWDQEAA